jgi:ribonuclease HI
MLLEWAKECGYSGIEVWCDSQLVVKQVNLEWAVRPPLVELCARAHFLLSDTKSTLKHLRGHAGTLGNEVADAICNEVLDEAQGKVRKNAQNS